MTGSANQRGRLLAAGCSNDLTWRPGSRAQVIVSSASLSTGGIFKRVKIACRR